MDAPFLLDGIKRESLFSVTGIYMCNGRGYKKTSLCEQPLCTCRSGNMFLRLAMGHVPRKVRFVRDKELLSF